MLRVGNKKLARSPAEDCELGVGENTARGGRAKGLECRTWKLPNGVEITGEFCDKVCPMISSVKLRGT